MDREVYGEELKMTLPRKDTLTQQDLKMYCTYDYETGILEVREWVGNKIRKNKKGYLTVCLDGRQYMIHRLVWLYHYGKFPEAFIDHRNGKPDDNRIDNLRQATRQQNEYNKGAKKGKLSRYKGVARNKDKWCARIRTPSGRLYLGSFNTEDEAYNAYCEAAKKIQGEFFRL